MKKDNLTRFLDDERYCIKPLPNFFFTRDACFSFGDEIIISKMANSVRDREDVMGLLTTCHLHHWQGQGQSRWDY